MVIFVLARLHDCTGIIMKIVVSWIREILDHYDSSRIIVSELR